MTTKQNFKGENIPKTEELSILLSSIEDIEKNIKNRNLISLRELIEKEGVFKDVLKDYLNKKRFNTKYPKKRKIENDYEGLYIFIDGSEPVYVGITRSIVNRLRSHSNGTTTATATLAYLIAKKEGDYSTEQFNDNKNKIRDKYIEKVNDYKVYIYPFPDVIPEKGHEYYSLSLFEIMLAIKLRTKWNTFKTH